MSASDSQLDSALSFLQSSIPNRPTTGIVLGTGAGQIADDIADAIAIKYDSIPGFVSSTATGHKGQLIVGRLNGQHVIAMQGRFHLYEGWPVEQVTFPIRVMIELGIEQLIVTNAAGGIHPHMSSGQLMVIESHIDLMGHRLNKLGSAPCKQTDRPITRGDQPYNQQMMLDALEYARVNNFVLHRGTYVGMLGPNYETSAEYRFLRSIGGDAAGMSTIPEVLLAQQHSIPVLAFSIIANVANPDQLAPTSGQEVIDLAQIATGPLCALINSAVASIKN